MITSGGKTRNMGVEQYIGVLPYPPDQKRPASIKANDCKAYLCKPDVPEESLLVEIGVSTDQLNCGFATMGPGGTWHFVDEHPGDETYYIISGSLSLLECATGECLEAHPGDTLFLPMGCKYKGYNFSEENLRVFWAIAPVMRLPRSLDYPHHNIRTYRNPGMDISQHLPPDTNKLHRLQAGDINQLGKFPVDGDEARQDPIHYYLLNSKNCITTVFGLKRPMRMRFFVSNDLMHVGEFYLPAGGVGCRVSEVDEHGGDTVIYGVRGPITVFFPDTQEVFQVQEGEMMYIPPHSRHQFINYNSSAIIGYFVAAKEL